jgi:hypothetical protein
MRFRQGAGERILFRTEEIAIGRAAAISLGPFLNEPVRLQLLIVSCSKLETPGCVRKRCLAKGG